MGLLNRMHAMGGGMGPMSNFEMGGLMGSGGQTPPYLPGKPEMPQINPGPQPGGMPPGMGPMSNNDFMRAFSGNPGFQQQLGAMQNRTSPGFTPPNFIPPPTPAQPMPQQGGGSGFNPNNSALLAISPTGMQEWLRQHYPNIGG